MRRNTEYYDNLHQPTPGGPLMTNHLHDLNIQLELLKRKREIIQQEQEILNRFTTKRQYDYAHSSNTYDQQESKNHQFNTSNYSQRYDGPNNSVNFTRPQAAVKRQTPNQYWQSPPDPERFIAPQNINPWQTANVPQQSRFPIRKNFPPQLGNFSIGQIRPLMSIRPGISQRIQKNFPNQRKDFKPTKVTKPKAQQTLNKITPVPDVETKKLVSQVTDIVSKKAESKQILRVDKAPTLQVNGRLELALGTIMKEIKADHCANPKDLEYFNAPFVQRLLKHIIRTRIRSVMIDQVVGNFSDVVTKYRKKFPKETDIDLVKVAKDAQSLSTKSVGVSQLIESDDLQEFYNRNILKALVIKMDEMFLNLEKLYFKKDKDLDELVKNMPDPNIKKDTKTSKERQALIKQHKTNKDKINLESVIGDGDAIEVINEKLLKVKLYKDFMDTLIEQRLPKILPKFKDALLSMILTDKEFLTTKTMITSLLKKKLTDIIVKDVKCPKSTSLDNTKAKTDKPATSTASIMSTPVSESMPTAETAIENSKNVDSETLPDSSAVKVSDTEAVLKVESSETENVSISPSQELLNKSSMNKSPKTNGNTSPATPNKKSTEQKKPGTPIIPQLDDLLYVKLISRPNLPARAVIYDFLNKFKPTSIKKHKSINNLLVIGFKNKEDYDKILTVNETVIGNTTIIIKASEQVNKTNQSMSQGESNDSMSKSANQSMSDDSLLGSELENQISNLLTSIRKANEEDECPDHISDDINKPSEAIVKTEVIAKCPTESDNSVNTSCIDTEEKLDTAKTDENINMSEKNEQETKSQLDVKKEEESKETTIIADKVDVEITDSGNVNNLKGFELEPIIENSEDKKNDTKISNLADKPEVDKLKDTLKESGRATPTRSSSRLASSTPSIIRTRRASRLTQNN